MGKIEFSAVADYPVNLSHAIHWQPRVLAKEPNSMRRQVKEALAIRKLDRRGSALNMDRGLEQSKVWLALL